MTKEERAEVGIALINSRKAYERTIDDGTLKFMLDLLKDQDAKKVIHGINAYCINPKNKFPPTIADIMGFVNPVLDDETLGVEAASRVVHAVSKYGHNNGHLAQEYIGELGWMAVERYGGWNYICANLGMTLQVPSFQAQVREICRAQAKAAKFGLQDTPPALPQNENKKGLQEPVRFVIPAPRDME